MCRSQADGGQRCYAHAAPRFAAARAALDEVTATAASSPGPVARRRQDDAEQAYLAAGITLASTPQGHQEILDLAQDALTRGDHDRAGMLLHMADAGAQRREVNAAVAAAIGSARPAKAAPASAAAPAAPAAPVHTWAGEGGPRGLAEHLKMQHPGLTLILSDVREADVVVLSKIQVPETARRSGTGTKVMREVLVAADKYGWTVALTPDSAFGTSKTTLTKWYAGLGFVPNKGRHKVFETTEAMIRPPQGR